MLASMLRRSLWIALGAAVCVLPGCGKGDPPANNSGGTSATPTAAIANPGAKVVEEDDEEPDDPNDPELARVEPTEGTPEWLVREATKMHLEPPPQTDDVDKLKAHRKQRNEKIIQICQKAIAVIHDDPKKELLFTAAVRQMLEARLQLAVTGDHDAIDALYEDAAALFKRDPKSAAAGEGAHALVNLSYTCAKAAGSDSPWMGEFARQAVHFAGQFPAEERRALPLLYTAARSCELANMTKEALETYGLLQQNFGQSQYAARAAGVIRRLKLPGNPPQLSGPTVDGDQIVLDDLLGNPVLVIFWSAEIKPFMSQLPKLLEVTRARQKQGLNVIGVSIDPDPTTVRQFTFQQRITWPQIHYGDAARQGWNNPIVNYYGISDLPALWLIDQSGNVVSTSLTAETLDAAIGKLLAAGGATEPGAAAAGAAATSDASAAERPKKAPRKLRLEDE